MPVRTHPGDCSQNLASSVAKDYASKVCWKGGARPNLAEKLGSGLKRNSSAGICHFSTTDGRISNESGDCKTGRCPMQHKSQLLPMSSECRCAGEAAAVLIASTAHVHASNSQAFHGRVWHMSYHDINKFGTSGAC